MANRKKIKSRETLRNYRQLHDYCQACGIDSTRARYERWPGLEIHHLILGSGRSDEACNLLVLCNRCHQLCHNLTIRQPDGTVMPSLGLPVYLRIKRHRDPNNFDPERLVELRGGESLPEMPQHIPEVIEDEFRERRAQDVYKFDLLPWEHWSDFNVPEPRVMLLGKPVRSEADIDPTYGRSMLEIGGFQVNIMDEMERARNRAFLNGSMPLLEDVGPPDPQP
jgi:hypothetical protein